MIENTTSEIPRAISQVLRGAGASSGKFPNWGFAKPLGEIAVLTCQLAATEKEIEGLRQALAEELGVDPGARHPAVDECEEAGLEASAVLLFSSSCGRRSG